MTTLRLILGDQLNPDHSWYQQVSGGVVHVLMEVRQETDHVRHHAQKILAIFAAMRAFAAQLKARGHRVSYVALDHPSNRQSFTGNLDALVAHHGATRVVYQAPDEWRLDQVLAQWAQARRAEGLSVEVVDTEHFLSARDEAARFFGGRKQWLMEHFYRHMRRRHRILLQDDGQPAGGQWNFDADNRKPWRGEPPEPADWRSPHDHSELWRTIEASGAPHLGDPQADRLRWPRSTDEARQHLRAFVEQALPHFGDHQDALSHHAHRLFHSLLSFALNVKMLHPSEVIGAAEQAWRRGQAPLNAVEGFIRQILGWREYVRGVYWAHMPGYDERNHFGHDLPLPEWFWTGKTRMACMARAIGQSLSDAHAHHIQRLMVIGNFSLLAGLDPKALHRWYLGVYVDAFEWVELPNTLGMSQFADGGLLATKPYVASAAYIARMGDHCEHCPHDRKARLGEKACPFNALYWDFHLRHEHLLRGNPRIGMVYRQIDQMSEAAKQDIRDQARRHRENLHQL